MVRTSILRFAVSVAAVILSIANAPTCEARPSPFEKLDGADRVDLLDAPLDKTFLQRNLPEATTTPTPAPGDLSIIPMLTSMAPTAAPTAAETSGAMGMVQAAASLATAATTVLMATAVIA